MAEIDTRPLESVQAAVSIFDRGSDQSRLSLSPDRNEEEIVTITKELASCKLQLEARESQHKQDTLKVEALQKAVQELADQYEKDCMDAHLRIAQLEEENTRIMSRQAETDGECRALRDELAAVRGELDAAKASIAFVLREVEAMEMRAILERESTKDALSRILQLNETVLSSAVAAIKAEEERSVFFQEATLEFLGSERGSSEAVRRQMDMMETMEAELLAKTVEVEYLRSELRQVKEIYVLVSPQEASDATAVTAAVCSNSTDHGDEVQVQVQAQACEKTLDGHETEAEFTFQHPPEEWFVSEIFRKERQAVPPDGDRVETDGISEDLVEDKQGAAATVQDNEVAEGNSDAQETTGCLVAETSGEGRHAIQPHGKNVEADNSQEPAESDGALADLTACHGNDDLLLQAHELTKADASFVLESSRDDFQSVRSDAKGISTAEPETAAIIIAGNQEPRAEADAAPTPTPLEVEGDSDTGVVATDIVSKDEDEFYTKELEPEAGQGKKPDGYVIVSKSGDAADKDKQLDAARTEISDLRFSLEEAVRRAELAEEAKAALERELSEEIRRKHTPSRRRATSDSEDGWRPAREAGAPPAPAPARPRPTTPSHTHTPGTSSRALGSARQPGREDMPTPGCLTLGKVLSMRYK
ncbi:hypothetical protein BS78_01G438700 [Paspalum vaginatum]|nr:hypothetical protein BS78_01G438700 [Paspalum vaginatum]KAJ1298241.1 hypothetical protein BS78_01G438700 [Paspalum vaginatum]